MQQDNRRMAAFIMKIDEQSESSIYSSLICLLSYYLSFDSAQSQKPANTSANIFTIVSLESCFLQPRSTHNLPNSFEKAYKTKQNSAKIHVELVLAFLYLQSSNQTPTMQAQESKTAHHQPMGPDQQLRQLLTATYRGRTQADTIQAQAILKQSLNTPGFIDRLVAIITNQQSSQEQQKIVAASLIKNYSYDLSKQEGDKSAFIELLYSLIMQDNLNIKVKVTLGGALQHLLNEDECNNVVIEVMIYRDIIKKKIITILEQEEGLKLFDSCLAVMQAQINSLLVNMDIMIDYFQEILQPLCIRALQICEIIMKIPLEKWLIQDRFVMPKLNLLFEFLQNVIEKITEDEDDIGPQVEENLKNIRFNTYFIAVLQSYLLLFHNNHSIVSRVYSTINILKSTVSNITEMVYHSAKCPQKIFQIIFLTVLTQCKEVVNDLDVEHILVHCLSLIESHLQSKYYLQLFHNHKLEFVFAIFMYSVTNEEEYAMIEDDPDMFAEIAQSYCQGSKSSTFMKVRAACTLRIFAERIDEAPRNIIQILMVILSGSIGAQEQDSQIMRCVKAEFSQFNFYGLSNEQKLETSFLILAALSKQINRRDDMNKVMYAFFLTQFQALVRIDSHIIILRIVRAISYYPSALYFLYIETQMNRGNIFILQGIKALERILRTNKFAELFQFLSSIFTKLLTIVKIQDPIMQLIVMNYYDQMLKVNIQLYRACRNKIKESFFLNVVGNEDNSQHATLKCFNFLYFLIKKEKDPTILPLIENDFYEISDYLESDQRVSLYHQYQEKLIEIYQVIIEKSFNIKPQAERFALRSLKFLANQEKGSQIFKFYNVYLVKLDGALFKLDSYFRAFWEEIKRRFKEHQENNQSVEVIAYYCFLMSEVLANHCEILLIEEDLTTLMQMAECAPDREKQYPIIVLLTYLYMQPYPTVNFLKKYNIYEQFLSGIINIQFQGAIIKKIFNLAFVMLLEIEQNPQLIKQILIQCIHNLKELNRKTKKRLEQAPQYQVKARKFGEETSSQTNRQESMQDEDKNDNQLVNLFVKFKHPFENLSEFDQFKVKFWMNDHLIGDLDPEIKMDLRSIMETELVENSKVRIIKKVKRN